MIIQWIIKKHLRINQENGFINSQKVIMNKYHAILSLFWGKFLRNFTPQKIKAQ